MLGYGKRSFRSLANGRFQYALVVLVGVHDRVFAEPRYGAVGAFSEQRYAKIENAFRLRPDVEIRRFSGDQEIPHVTVAHQDFRPRRAVEFPLFVRDYQEFYRAVAADLVQVLDSVHHGREGAFHVVNAPPVEFSIVLVRLKLVFLTGHHVGVAVQEYSRLPGTHPDHERRKLTVRPRSPVSYRL